MPENTKIGYVILEGNDLDSRARIVSDKGRRIEAEGIVQTAEEENRNGRSYLRGDLYREYCQSPRTKELLELGYMRGETGHPLDNSIIRQQTIQPERCCVKYLKFWMEGNDGWARFKGTNNEYGDAFDADLRDGDRPAFSLRALGTLETIKGRNVVCNLRMITVDHVIYSSHPNANTKRLVTEAAIPQEKETYINTKNKMHHLSDTVSRLDSDKALREQYENKNGILIPVTNDQIISYIKSESANIQSILNQIDIFYESVQLTPNGRDVQLRTKAGDLFIVNLESYIQDEIQQYCADKYGF